MIKKYFLVLFLFTSAISFAQFKGDDSKPIDINSGILNDNPVGSLFSFINPENFSMNHSFGMSYSSFGNNGFALGVYTNIISYEFSEEVNFQINTSFVNSPYSTLGENFTNSINGVYIDNARINYYPSDKFKVSLQFSNSPYGYYNRSHYRGFSPLSNYWDEE
jgi:hypothetical protein